jgi:hypothetical protein
LLVADPVEPWAEAVQDRLLSSGWPSAFGRPFGFRPSLRPLWPSCLTPDAGTGRHAAALAAKGHHVDLADASERLLAQATSRNPSALPCTLTWAGMRAYTRRQRYAL